MRNSIQKVDFTLADAPRIFLTLADAPRIFFYFYFLSDRVWISNAWTHTDQGIRPIGLLIR